MVPGSTGDCCHARRCEKPAQKPTEHSNPAQQDCQTMPLDRFSGVHPHFDIAVSMWSIPSHVISAADVFDSTHAYPRNASHLDFLATSPPDLPILNASLLI